MSYQQAAGMIKEKMFAACSTNEQRQRLAGLVEDYPFLVGDIGFYDTPGEPTAGVYVRSEHQVYLAHWLGSYAPVDILGVYLHELVHAGAFGHRHPLMFHDERFVEALERGYREFGLYVTPVGMEYATREMPERWADRQPSWLGIVGVAGSVVAAGYLLINGFPDWQTASIFGCAFVILVLEKIRMRES